MSYNPRSTLLYQSLADVVVENTVAEASALAPTAMSAMSSVPPVIAAGVPQRGTKLQFTAWGAYKLPAVLNTLSLDFKITLGSATFTVTIPQQLFTLLSLGGTTALPCYFNLLLTYRSVGPAATLKRVGSLAFLDTSGNFKYQSLRGADLTVDTTADTSFDARVKWSAANAAASLTVDSAELTMVG